MLPPDMTRREALARIAWLTGGAIVGAELFLNGPRAVAGPAAPGFSAADIALLDEIGETILPATDTPGARAAHVGEFMAMMVRDCYDEAHRSIFTAGLASIDEESRRQCGKSFTAATPADRAALLTRLDAEARAHRHDAPVHYFRLMKQLTLLGFFTSESGCAHALRYVEVPGSFNGDVPYKKGDRAWYTPPNNTSV
jgi:hypothetical protein